MPDPILSVQNLTVSFGTKANASTVIRNLNFSIQPGQCVGIVGESGSGKSLTSLSIMQLLPPTAWVTAESKILFHGIDLLNYSEQRMRKVRGCRISMIFQDAMSALNPVFTVGNQMLEILALHKRFSKKQARLHALQLLEEVGLNDPQYCFDSYPHQLSGGMRQRAMIAMSICCEPEVLIADEPTTALDVTIQAQIIALLKNLQHKHNMTLLFISHDLAVVSQLADEIIVMQKGVKVEQATASQFFQNPQHEYSKKLLSAIPARIARAPTEKSSAILSVKNLKVYFPIQSSILKRTIGHVKAVDSVSFDLSVGQTLAIVGESGSGKTTTGKAIIQLLHNSGGQILFNNQDISTMSRQQLRATRSEMQIIFQDPFSSLDPRMLVIDSIAEGLITQNKVKSRTQAIPIIDRLLEQVELPLEAKWRYPHEFSGGERQRICIARALALEPKLLVLDEPTSALDVSIQKQVLQLLDKLQRELKLSYLLISHDIAVVSYLAQYIVVMYRGKIVEQGVTAEVLQQPKQEYTQKLLAAVPTIQYAKG